MNLKYQLILASSATTPKIVETYRLDISLLGLNPNAPVEAFDKYEYYEKNNIINMSGGCILSGRENNGINEIDLAHLLPGAYYFQFANRYQVISVKIIK